MNIGISSFCAAIALCAHAANAATLPGGFSEVAITGGNIITEATGMAFSPDGKLFVLEQGGTIEVYQGAGATTWTRRQANFFANTPLNVDESDERGLLGIAFDPNYLTNRFVYVYYTVGTGAARNRIARYKANANGDLAIAGSARTIMDLDNLSGAGNHNGGAMHFGPDGKLYVAVGDNANAANSQSNNTRLGKILRLNPNPNNPIPANNPTSIEGIPGTTSGANRAIWCAGLRNPYSFAFKPGTSVMYINDVGQSSFEEVNVGAAGANYGWDDTEGDFNQGSFPDFTRPIIAYHHNDQTQSFPPNGNFTGFAITGAAFYVPQNNTFGNGYIGDYFFADFISDWIRRYDPNTGKVSRFASHVDGPVALCVGNDGALYYLARNAQSSGAGRVYRVQRN